MQPYGVSEHLGLGVLWFARPVLLAHFFHWVTLANSLL